MLDLKSIDFRGFVSKFFLFIADSSIFIIRLFQSKVGLVLFVTSIDFRLVSQSLFFFCTRVLDSLWLLQTDISCFESIITKFLKIFYQDYLKEIVLMELTDDFNTNNKS